MSDNLETREQFEEWVQSPPMEKSTERMGKEKAWPGQYRDYDVQIAWEAWCAAQGVDAYDRPQ